MLNKLIIDTLKPLGVPVAFQDYTGSSKTYITFFLYSEQGQVWADDKEVQTAYYVQLDLWTDGDYTDLVNSIMELMTNAGFKRTFAIDLYDNEAKIYHKSLRFNYFN